MSNTKVTIEYTTDATEDNEYDLLNLISDQQVIVSSDALEEGKRYKVTVTIEEVTSDAN